MAEKKINGRDFRVTAFPAREALALYADVVRLLAPALPDVPAILGFLTSEDLNVRQQADLLIVNSQAAIFAQSSAADVVAILERIVKGAEVRRASGSYEQADLDGDFTDDLGALQKVVIFVMQENYRDFLGASGSNGIFDRLLAALQSRK